MIWLAPFFLGCSSSASCSSASSASSAPSSSFSNTNKGQASEQKRIGEFLLVLFSSVAEKCNKDSNVAISSQSIAKKQCHEGGRHAYSKAKKKKKKKQQAIAILYYAAPPISQHSTESQALNHTVKRSRINLQAHGFPHSLPLPL